MKTYHFEYMDDIAKKEYITLSKNEYCKDKKLEISEVDNGIVLPANLEYNPQNALWGSGGVVDENGKYVETSAQVAFNMSNRIDGKYEWNLEEVHYCDETVIYMNFFLVHWGHFLIDIVNRLWYVIDQLKQNKKVKIVYTVEKGEEGKISGNFLEFLNLLGIEEKDLMMINQPTRFKKIIIPESSIYPGKYYTKEYKKIFDTIKEKVENPTVRYDKVYFSRRSFIKYAGKKEVGEKAIEKFFKENGFQIIQPETCTLKQQIQILKNSKIVAAMSGTLPHNLLFANDGTQLLIINKTIKANSHQFLIDEIRNLDVTYIDCHISLFPVLYGPGPFVITITEHLLKFAKDNQYKIKYHEKYNQMLNKIKILWYFVKYIKIYKKFPAQGNETLVDIAETYNYYRKKII